jgi:signal transduction histidine kinase
MANAAKYTEAGGQIGIRVSASEDRVKVEVSDNGVGIAPEFMPRLFEMFAQANRSLDRSQGGLGIGLSVVRKLIEMHGGQVTAHSKGLGHGSIFEISLPRAQPPLPAPAPSADNRAAARRILC